MATCIIHLENYQGQYYPGSTIIGKVICSYTKPLNIRGVRVELRGKEHTEYTKTETIRDKRTNQSNVQTVRYSGNNNVLEVVTTLTGEGNYPAGRHEYPFNFSLPKNLPATYDGKSGWIRYEIKGTVVIPFGFDHQDVKQLKVVAPVDLNEIPGLQMTPVSYTAEKNVWWFFRSCGLITVKVGLEKNGFVQGESVKVKLEVSNMSTENVTKVEVTMGMVIESSVTFPTKETKADYEILAVASDTGVGAHGERAYTFDLVVPHTFVPNFSICKLFKHSAKIDIKAVVKGMHSNLELTAPIYLGNIPVRDQNTFQNMPFQQSSYPMSSYVAGQAAAYPSPGSSPYFGYPATATQSSALSRQPPPPYSEFSQHTSSPAYVYPEIPPPTPAQNYTPYPSKPVPITTPQLPPQYSVTPSAPKEEEDDDFILL